MIAERGRDSEKIQRVGNSQTVGGDVLGVRNFLGCCGGGVRLEGAGMKKIVIGITILMLVGCDKIAIPTGVNSANALTRYVDSQNSVICYQAMYQSSTAISCVQLDREVRDASK